MTARPILLAFFVLLALSTAASACGGAETSTLPDESGDLGFGGESTDTSAGTVPVGPEVAGTRWQWIEAHCTEGPLDLAPRGFAQELRIESDDEGLLLTYDQTFAAESCTQTVVQRARPREDGRHFTMVEEVRVAQPSTEECLGSMEQERIGEVRRAGDLLEVLVQRSFVWCNGFEARMIYAPAPTAMLAADQIVRRYAAHFNRRDALRVAGLFADSGSLVEPFHVTHTGGASRHDGRQAIQAYYEETFSGVPWLAFQLGEVATGESDGQFIADWRYMDPRVSAPFAGRTHFTIAAGEIFESRIELTEPPVEGDGAAGTLPVEGEASSDAPSES